MFMKGLAWDLEGVTFCSRVTNCEIEENRVQ